VRVHGYVVWRKRLYSTSYGGSEWCVMTRRSSFFRSKLASGIDWARYDRGVNYRDRWWIFSTQKEAMEKRESVEAYENVRKQVYEYKTVPI
jgi:hypothetical protein